MKTFHVQTLGCKVNHYESEQIAALLIARGLEPADAKDADLKVVNTCSVTMQAASQSRQSVRRMVRLPVFSPASPASSSTQFAVATKPNTRSDATGQRSRVIVTGCWATSNAADASALPGVDAVLGHHHDVAVELDRLLTLWQTDPAQAAPPSTAEPSGCPNIPNILAKSLGKVDQWKEEVAASGGHFTLTIEPKSDEAVNRKPILSALSTPHPAPSPGTTSLPLLGGRQVGRQRAFLKIQDGCDAHCTYCIIPTLRPSLWSKPVVAAVEEARALVASGHVEIVLTGIFLGAYGQPTALRRRQPRSTAKPLGELIEALCTEVPGLRRVRLSSLEPGDLTEDLTAIFRSHPQVVLHFHLPLQSGSDLLLRRMNRQYTRDDFLRMVDRLKAAFDRPALTTDIVTGFPGETDGEFEKTAEVVRLAGFIHVHAFPYSPRPGTAAARWTGQFVRGPVVNERIDRLRELAAGQSFAFRSSFLGETVEVIIERDSETASATGRARHGRCERYFPVSVDDPSLKPGDSVRVKIVEVTPEETRGTIQCEKALFATDGHG